MKRNPACPFSVLAILFSVALTNNLPAVMTQSPLKAAYNAGRNLALFAGSYYAFDIIFYHGEKTQETIDWARQKIQNTKQLDDKNPLLAEEKIDKEVQQRQKPATLFELIGRMVVPTQP